MYNELLYGNRMNGEDLCMEKATFMSKGKIQILAEYLQRRAEEHQNAFSPFKINCSISVWIVIQYLALAVGKLNQ